MNAPTTTCERIEAAVAALGDAPLAEDTLQRHLVPLFSRHKLGFGDRVYLANHSLGRPLDATADDVAEGLSLWYAHQGGAWNAWNAEIHAYRSRLARLLGNVRADCVVPRTSAGQGLRAVLNTYDRVPRVVATRGEFDSLDVILREYAARGRIELAFVEARAEGLFDLGDIVAGIGARVDLVVVSQVMFNTGQRLDIAPLADATHAAGGWLLVDVYHALGVVPVDMTADHADFAVGGGYKYLRGGPGACFLWIHPRHLDGGLRTLDIGWFAKDSPFDYTRPDPPRYAPGGDGWMESTPAVLPFYQARAGLVLTLALGVARIREYSLDRQRRLVDLLAARGVAARGARADHGAFVVVTDARAKTFAEALRGQDIVTDARGPYLRLCPDLLTTAEELTRAADALARLLA